MKIKDCIVGPFESDEQVQAVWRCFSEAGCKMVASKSLRTYPEDLSLKYRVDWGAVGWSPIPPNISPADFLATFNRGPKTVRVDYSPPNLKDYVDKLTFSNRAEKLISELETLSFLRQEIDWTRTVIEAEIDVFAAAHWLGKKLGVEVLNGDKEIAWRGVGSVAYDHNNNTISSGHRRPDDWHRVTFSEWLQLKKQTNIETIDWTKVCIECEGHGQEVAEWLGHKISARPHSFMRDFKSCKSVGVSAIYKRVIDGSTPEWFESFGYTRMSYEEWRQHAYGDLSGTFMPLQPVDWVDPGLTGQTSTQVIFDDPPETRARPEIMNRDQAHELHGDAFTEWVRANRDSVGLKSVAQQKEEAAQALIDEVRRAHDDWK